MSYEISYRRQAFMMPAAEALHYEDLLFLVEETGSNNCWETGNRRRARNWQCTAVGAPWECLAEVTRTAAACCGGSLVLYGRRKTTPEQYIRAWRRAMAAPVPFGEAHKLGFGFQLFTRMSEAEAADGRKLAFECLRAQSQVMPERYERNGGAGWDWQFDAAVSAQVKLWRETRESRRGWHSVEAWGPDH